MMRDRRTEYTRTNNKVRTWDYEREMKNYAAPARLLQPFSFTAQPAFNPVFKVLVIFFDLAVTPITHWHLLLNRRIMLTGCEWGLRLLTVEA
jgi:hypothetical protein